MERRKIISMILAFIVSCITINMDDTVQGIGFILSIIVIGFGFSSSKNTNSKANNKTEEKRLSKEKNKTCNVFKNKYLIIISTLVIIIVFAFIFKYFKQENQLNKIAGDVRNVVEIFYPNKVGRIDVVKEEYWYSIDVEIIDELNEDEYPTLFDMLVRLNDIKPENLSEPFSGSNYLYHINGSLYDVEEDNYLEKDLYTVWIKTPSKLNPSSFYTYGKIVKLIDKYNSPVGYIVEDYYTKQQKSFYKAPLSYDSNSLNLEVGDFVQVGTNYETNVGVRKYRVYDISLFPEWAMDN